MPVRIREKKRFKGTATPTELNSETTVIDLPNQADDFILEGQISLQNMQSGDTVILKFYIAVDGENQVLSDNVMFMGAQAIPVVRIPSTTLAYDSKPKITLTQTTGVPRSYPYSIIIQVMEVI
jgi:hypothetical protein